MVEKDFFWDKKFEIEIFMDLHILRSLESVNHIIRSWFVCVLSKFKKYIVCLVFWCHIMRKMVILTFNLFIMHIHHFMFLK